MNLTNDAKGSAGAELADLVGPFWSETRLWSSTAPGLQSTAALDGPILALKTSDGATVYPVSQFEHREGQMTVKAGLRPLMTALAQFDSWAVAVLLVTPAPELDGYTPMQWVDAGLDPAVLAGLALQVAREWNAGSDGTTSAASVQP